jgi:hypothetical protein
VAIFHHASFLECHRKRYRRLVVELFLALTRAARCFLPDSLMKPSKLSNYSFQEEIGILKNGEDVNSRPLLLETSVPRIP